VGTNDLGQTTKHRDTALDYVAGAIVLKLPRIEISGCMQG
jgi:hypothetical protein